ncbi:MAG: hypothetical protein JWQ74_3536 [Marmoricola sp.]|nr:hypothetical protein [Marmoricola sp.]
MTMTCMIDECSGRAKARGWCSKHYQRWVHHGDPLALSRTAPGVLLKFLHEVAVPYPGDDCLIWPFAKNPAGYGKVSINGVQVHTNRYVCEAAHGVPPSPEHEAAHSCGKGHTGCISPSHLHWATPQQNQQERVLHGTDNRCEKHPMAKLTESDVRAIFALMGTQTQIEIALKYGVDRRHVGLIHRGKTWKSLDLRTGAYRKDAA